MKFEEVLAEMRKGRAVIRKSYTRSMSKPKIRILDNMFIFIDKFNDKVKWEIIE